MPLSMSTLHNGRMGDWQRLRTGNLRRQAPRLGALEGRRKEREMTEKIRQIIEEAVGRFEEEQEDPRLLILGATGVGKSSLINAIFDKKLQEVGPTKSTTRKFATHKYVMDGTTILITDSPGYGEIGHDKQYSGQVITEAKTAHAVTLVLKADEKGYERDRQIIGDAGKDPDFSLEKPLLIALNQIDKLKPRGWNPPYEWEAPPRDDDSEKVRNIREKVALVKDQFKTLIGKREPIIVPTMADEEDGPIFGIDKFKLKLLQILPETARYRFARSAKLAEEASREVLEQLDKEADNIIKGAAASAAGLVAVNPVPASDIAVLAPLQIGMIIKLGAIYGKAINRNSALEVITTLGTGLAARTVFQGVISLLPVVKNVLGPPYAAAATYGIGQAAKAYFKGRGVPSLEEMKSEVERELRSQQKSSNDKRGH